MYNLAQSLDIQGVPKKMFLSEIGALLTKEHFSGTLSMQKY